SPAARRSATRFCRWRCWSPSSRCLTRRIPASTSTPSRWSPTASTGCVRRTAPCSSSPIISGSSTTSCRMSCMCCRTGGSCAPAAASWRWNSKPRAMPRTRTRRRDAMTAEIMPIKTAAESGFAEAFAALRGGLADGAIAARREAAFRHFEAQGLPHRRVEEWKYTDLRALMRDAKPLAGAPDAEAKARAKDALAMLPAIEARRVVFVGGALVPELSDLSGLEAGPTIRSMAQALAAGDRDLLAHLGRIVPTDDVAVALNTAFMGDGAVI